LEEWGVSCGRRQSKATPAQILIKTKPLVEKFLIPKSLISLRHNSIYTQIDYLRLLVHTAINNNYAEGSSKQWELENEIGGPTGESLLYHIKKKTPCDLESIFDGITDELIALAKKQGGIGKKVDVAIDFTHDLYYGDKHDPMVVPTQPQRGTSRAYKYATLNIVEHGQRFTLKTLAVDSDTPTKQVVTELIVYAKRLVNINHVLVDRGFYSVDVISALKKLDCKYLMPAVHTGKVVKLLRMHNPMTSVRYKIGSGSKSTFTNLVTIIDKRGEKRGFITNIEDQCSISKLSTYYSKRWGIETSYRMMKKFRSKTTSKNPVIRLFHFLFGVCLYNLWLLANINAATPLYPMPLKYDIESGVFGSTLLRVIRMMGAGPPCTRNVQPSGSPEILVESCLGLLPRYAK